MNKHTIIPINHFTVRIMGGIIAFTLFCIIALICGQIVIANRFSIGGKQLAEIEDTTRQLQEENEQLTQAIASASSLLTIESKARMLGFTKIETIAVTAAAPVAFER